MTQKFRLLPFIFFLVFHEAGRSNAQESGVAPKSFPMICFTENKGQIHDQNDCGRPDILFSSIVNGVAIHLRKNGISYQLSKEETYKEKEDLKTHFKKRTADKISVCRLDLNWLNCDSTGIVSKAGELQGYDNYYIGNSSEGIRKVKSFTKVLYQNIYAGIDLVWYVKNGELKYEYYVAPNSDFKQIQIKIQGAESISLNSKGELQLKTPFGIITEQAPYVFQNEKLLPSNWKLNDDIVSFEIKNVDKRKGFTIDPVIRAWATYYGGTANDDVNSCVTSPAGDLYIAGHTQSTGTIIATTGSYQSTLIGSNSAFLAKFGPNGDRLWGTYYAGSSGCDGTSCAIDPAGNIYMTGITQSTLSGAIATPSSHQPNYGGGYTDAYLVKFDSTGARLWGTYYGGNNEDLSYSCSCDILGNVYISGYTKSTNGTSIATLGSHQPSFGGGAHDAFLVKFNPSGMRLWGTYYGGVGYDQSFSCSSDLNGNVYLSGKTSSGIGTVIASPNCHQMTYAGGNDAFLVKFSANGTRVWGTYCGGPSFDSGNYCAADNVGNVYLTGETTTYGGTSIATIGSYQPTLISTTSTFLEKFNTSGVRQWGTYYGKDAYNCGRFCCTDNSGNIFLTGITQSGTGTAVATGSGYQTTYGGGLYDAFLVQFDSSGMRQWGTYYGGPDTDIGSSCAISSSGDLFIAGSTMKNSAPSISSLGSYQPSYGGGNYDGMLIKFNYCSGSFMPVITTNNNTICIGQSYTIAPGVVVSPSVNSSYSLITQSSGCSYSLINSYIAIDPDTILILNSSSGQVLCKGNTATLTVSGALSYTWSNGGNDSTLVITPSSTTTYSVSGVGFNRCLNSTSFVQQVDECSSVYEQISSDSGVTIFPNPSSDKFNLSGIKNATIKVCDVLGHLIVNQLLKEDFFTIDFADQKNGLYILQVQKENKLEFYKLIKN